MFLFLCILVAMAGLDGAFLSDILNGDDGVVIGLDETAIPNTQDNDIRADEVQASRSSKGGRRSKKFSLQGG
jgi:hypothetical protein